MHGQKEVYAKMYDCIVLGTGGIGSAALLAAARKGLKVIGIEQFGAAHNLGSSHGQTRMIRTAYFEHPHYVPMALSAWEHWDRLQKTTKEVLVRRTGVVQLGDPNGTVVSGVLKSAEQHGLEVQKLEPSQIKEKFPLIKPGKQQLGVFEKNAGFLRVEKCIATMLKQAKDLGATLKSNTTITSWAANDDGTFTVHAGDEVFNGRKLIVTAGAWAKQVLTDLKLPLRVVRKQQHWFQNDRIDGHYKNGFPFVFVETDQNDWFYATPQIDKLGIKIAEHSGGETVEDPSELNREIDDSSLIRASQFVDSYLDFGHHSGVYSSVCMYTMTPDEHFIVDVHPDYPGLSFAAGMSGHGFKFAPVIGEALVNMAEGQLDERLNFLRLDRFAGNGTS